MDINPKLLSWFAVHHRGMNMQRPLQSFLLQTIHCSVKQWMQTDFKIKKQKTSQKAHCIAISLCRSFINSTISCIALPAFPSLLCSWIPGLRHVVLWYFSDLTQTMVAELCLYPEDGALDSLPLSERGLQESWGVVWL